MEVTYEYYENSFYGENIAETDFPKWLKRASDKLNLFTFQRIDENLQSEYEIPLKNAVCALADCMYLVDCERSRAAEPLSEANIKSMSSGGESISYETKKTIYQEVLQSRREEYKLYRGTVAEYLFDTGLLYAGG